MGNRRQFLALFPFAKALWGDSAWEDSPTFHAFFNLDFDAAIAALDAETRAQPQDPNPHNHLAYALLYRTLFRAGALNTSLALSPASFLRKPKIPMDGADQGRFAAALQKAKDLSWNRLQSHPRDAQAKYTLGVAELHRANHLFLIEKQWRPALKLAGEARRLHGEAYALNAELTDALLVPGVHDYVIGSLPALLRALGFLAGFRGDKERGLRNVAQVAAKGRRARIEANVLLALMHQREKQLEQALSLMRPLARRFPANHLYQMEVVNLLTAQKRIAEAEKEFTRLESKDYRFLSPTAREEFRQRWQAAKSG
ncbi:MAG: hypothetical protein NW208_19125 [Bryobacter sp.]|nr:hypothetical protein [Bryobacter sp.]